MAVTYHVMDERKIILSETVTVSHEATAHSLIDKVLGMLDDYGYDDIDNRWGRYDLLKLKRQDFNVHDLITANILCFSFVRHYHEQDTCPIN